MNVMLHLGLGSFHRAHQAVYLDALIRSGDASWALAGGNIRPDMAETMAALAAQGGAYTLETISPAGEHRYQRIGSIRQVIAYQPDLAGLIEQGAKASTRIISFTVTEAGYYLDADNRLDWPTFPDLRADLEAVKLGLAGHTVSASLWLAEGWDWVRSQQLQCPLYWQRDDAGHWQEFTLSYDEVRTATDPEAVLTSFLQSTYDAAADLDPGFQGDGIRPCCSWGGFGSWC